MKKAWNRRGVTGQGLGRSPKSLAARRPLVPSVIRDLSAGSNNIDLASGNRGIRHETADQPGCARTRQRRSFVGSQIPPCTVTDVENPNGLALLIHFVKNPVNPAALTKKETTNISPHVPGLTSHRATIGKLFQGI
jgi:hypothetical protein